MFYASNNNNNDSLDSHNTALQEIDQTHQRLINTQERVTSLINEEENLLSSITKEIDIFTQLVNEKHRLMQMKIKHLQDMREQSKTLDAHIKTIKEKRKRQEDQDWLVQAYQLEQDSLQDGIDEALKTMIEKDRQLEQDIDEDARKRPRFTSHAAMAPSLLPLPLLPDLSQEDLHETQSIPGTPVLAPTVAALSSTAQPPHHCQANPQENQNWRLGSISSAQRPPVATPPPVIILAPNTPSPSRAISRQQQNAQQAVHAPYLPFSLLYRYPVVDMQAPLPQALGQQATDVLGEETPPRSQHVPGTSLSMT